ncbi:MAG: NAD(P)-dependent alcohol dehydrogenase, partial [Chthoniobacterales bacterium]
MPSTKAYAAQSKETPLAPYSFERRNPLPGDVQLEILFCGVCHSDLHTVRSEWGESSYPCVPGHEIVGRVTQVGTEVKNFRAGDLAAVGCMVDSCHRCTNCCDGLEQFCTDGATFTYNSVDKESGGHTLGGYSKSIVVDQQFVLRVSKKLDLAATAPLLCAGITTYSPLRHWNAGPGKKVGVVGIGGLGHMGVKIAHAMGAHVVAFTTSEAKRQDALDLGANEVVVSRNASEMKAHAASFDLILNTVAASHSLDAYSSLLKRDGTLVLIGVPEHPHPSPNVGNLIFK